MFHTIDAFWPTSILWLWSQLSELWVAKDLPYYFFFFFLLFYFLNFLFYFIFLELPHYLSGVDSGPRFGITSIFFWENKVNDFQGMCMSRLWVYNESDWSQWLIHQTIGFMRFLYGTSFCFLGTLQRTTSVLILMHGFPLSTVYT